MVYFSLWVRSNSNIKTELNPNWTKNSDWTLTLKLNEIDSYHSKIQIEPKTVPSWSISKATPSPHHLLCATFEGSHFTESNLESLDLRHWVLIFLTLMPFSSSFICRKNPTHSIVKIKVNQAKLKSLPLNENNRF